jgi:hypothetical protein
MLAKIPEDEQEGAHVSVVDPNFVEMIVEQVTSKVTENLTETLRETFTGDINVNVHVRLDTIKIQHLPPPGAVRAVIILKGSPLPGQINIDTTNETASLEFTDRVGEKTNAPDGAVVAWSTSDAAVATATADPNDASGLTAQVTPVAAGDCTVLADVSGATEPDGSPFPQASVPLHVDPGAATGDRISLSQ